MFHSSTHYSNPISLSPFSISLSLSSSLYPSFSHQTNMSQNSMPPISSSSNPTFHDHGRLEIESIRILVVSVNQHILRLLEDPETRKSLQLRCTSKLKIQKQDFFEFSEHSVLSNLYWGIDNFEAAIQAKWPEDRTSRLKNSERMLQVPALLDEHGSTGGIQNRYLVCCSYFYLSLVRKLQRDEWQVTLHFLQALLVYPRLVRVKFTPDLWESVFLSQIISSIQEMDGWSGLQSESVVDFFDNTIDEVTKQLARKYKDRLMYFQVMLYGETPQWHWGCRVAPLLDDESQSFRYGTSTSTEYVDSVGHDNGRATFQGEKVHPLEIQEEKIDKMESKAKASIITPKQKSTPTQDDERALVTKVNEIHDGHTEGDIIDEMEGKAKASIITPKRKSTPTQDIGRALATKVNEIYNRPTEGNLHKKCLQDMLKESQSDTPTSVDSSNDSPEESDTEEEMDNGESSARIMTTAVDNTQPEIRDRKLQSASSRSNPECIQITLPESPRYPLHEEGYEINTSYFFSRRFFSSINDLNLSVLELRDIDSNTFCNRYVEEGITLRRSEQQYFRLFDHILSMQKGNNFTKMDQHGNSARKQDSSNRKKLSETSLYPEEDINMEIMGMFEKAVSTLCFSQRIGKIEENDNVEVSIMWEMLNNKTEAKYGLLKDVILDHLLNAISTSKQEWVIRASVSIISTLVLKNRAVIKDIMKKGLRLRDLASALKRNVHEAVVLIYLINPSPVEIQDLELLPALLEVACNSNRRGPISLQLTPPAASLMMIELLVTAFDYTTNNMHLAAISSPQVFSKLVKIARNKNLEEMITLAGILIKCMQFDGKCRNILSQSASMVPFIHLLRRKEKGAKIIALQFFHELLRMPRTSAINLLHQIRQPDSINIMHTLLSCIQQLQPEYRLMAVNLLLQLDMLEGSSGTSIFREEAMEVLLEAIVSEEGSETQMLAAFIFSNLGGTYAWTGEPYTVAWLVRKAGLTSLHHRNMIRNFDWSDQSLQDGSIDAWCSRIARNIIKIGNPIFHALEKGLQSKIKNVSRNCLIAIAWIGYEFAITSAGNLRYSACEILLNGIQQFLHPGLELEERLLACLCVYNYTSGKGMRKLIHFSEGVRESLRRLSSITWMAEELLSVTDYFLPTKSRVSCVHTQIIEASQKCCGAASALIYYKGQLHSGHSDGSIKVWDIKGQTASLVWDVKEHKKAVTCFTLSRQGDSLLSGSSDRTIRVWQMVRRRLKCVEVIETTEPINKIDTYEQQTFVITQSRGLKVFDASRNVKTICKNKHVKSIAVIKGKLYLGCMDSSIQEVDTTNDWEREIKAPAKSWRLQNRPVNSVLVYKDWLYSASTIVEGSNLKEWRTHNEPQMSITMGKGTYVQEMGVVEDFIYLNCSSSPNIIQIWLRGAQRNVGRLSAGSKITSLLTANDIVLCGTETGLIKGWIPL